MKITLFLFLVLLSQVIFAGVGGSTGGDLKVNNPSYLEYYLNYSAFIYDIPTVDFSSPDAETVILPITKACIRNNDQIESKEEVEVTFLDFKHAPVAKVREIVRRDRKYLKKLSIFNIFNKEGNSVKEVEIPRDYKINISQSASKGNRLLRIIDYSISECD